MPGFWNSGRVLQISASVAVMATGAILLITGYHVGKPGPPPQPPVSVMTAPPAMAVKASIKPLAFAKPTHLTIPSINVSTRLLTVGLNTDGTIQVPPLSDVSKAAWYRYGPAPGEAGASVLVGHVDSKSAPGVFYKLGSLRPGQTVTVDREDRTRVTFRITRIERVPKDRFPTAKVYGQLPDPELRLITCSGKFDRSDGHYTDNLIVYASMTGVTEHR